MKLPPKQTKKQEKKYSGKQGRGSYDNFDKNQNKPPKNENEAVLKIINTEYKWRKIEPTLFILYYYSLELSMLHVTQKTGFTHTRAQLDR